MIGEIIAIGDELTSGRILNSNSYFAASQLFAAGHEIVSLATIGDEPEEIGAALKRALVRSDFIVVTGGLGATSDDLTNDAVAEALGRPVIFYPEIYKIICKTGGGGTRENKNTLSPDRKHLEKLAWLPAGAEILKPGARMAGHILIHDKKPIFFLPGVPHEMRELMVDRVIPYLAVLKADSAREVSQKVYKVFGLPEVQINQMLKDLEGDGKRVRIGYYPVFPEVHVSLTVFGTTIDECQALFMEYDKEVETILGMEKFGVDDDTMESVVGTILQKQGKTLAVAESCSGGLISHRITKVPGSSAYFLGGVVAYSNLLKELLLSVDGSIIEKHGAVSAESARAMAAGIRAKTGADIAISVTGIAGPTGGTKEKPVGTVFIGLATQDETKDLRFNFFGDRWQVQLWTTLTALDVLRRKLLGVALTPQKD